MFTFNGIGWRVEFTNPRNPIFMRGDGTYAPGVCVNDTKTIYLADSLEGKMLKKVLCHEIVHAAMFSYNVILSIDQEELMADIIATYGDEIIEITNKVFKKLQLF